ncbi:MAG: YifB family Mg chelatase-like AAA ATPase, partial [Ruminococcus sp.]|nr:YifB family Mg chelatase-like AAA ATPase [Ruminococcus sp.]
DLEIAAAGGHNALLIGSPGSGKSMLAKRMPSILPPLTFEEALETTKIHSISGLLTPETPIITKRPFRSPHHTISSAGLAGGGTIPHPGEVSLAHNGLLFLDELAEFDRKTLEILRQPLEDRKVTIARASGTVSYPCTIMLIGAMNPCPCGYYGHPKRKCICPQKKVANYLSKISGPLLDRFDLHIEVAPVEFGDLSSKAKEESSADIRKRVMSARKIQEERFKGTAITCNALITPDKLQEMCPMDENAEKLMKNVFDKLGLSARAYDRILKVARTIADIDNSEVIKKQHIAAAAQYRSLDRKYWSEG